MFTKCLHQIIIIFEKPYLRKDNEGCMYVSSSLQVIQANPAKGTAEHRPDKPANLLYCVYVAILMRHDRGDILAGTMM